MDLLISEINIWNEIIKKQKYDEPINKLSEFIKKLKYETVRFISGTNSFEYLF